MIEDGRQEGIETGRAEGIETGTRESLLSGIKAMIKTCEELGISKEDTMERLMKKLCLKDKVAEGYLKKYWR